MTANRPADLGGVCDALREMLGNRTAALRMENRLRNAARAYVRRSLGWQWDSEPAERERINAAAAKAVGAILKGETPPDIPAITAGFIAASFGEAIEPMRRTRASTERAMKALAVCLPVWPWVEGVRGLGALGLALIVGATGDLSNYAGPAKVWKRLGVGMHKNAEGGWEADRRMAGEEGVGVGYSPRRRSLLWTVTDSLLKAKNPYKTLYDKRKAYELARAPEMTKMHAHRRAQRYAGKRLVLDLWKAWHAGGDQPRLKPTPRMLLPA